jgi:hypothetical protein
VRAVVFRLQLAWSFGAAEDGWLAAFAGLGVSADRLGPAEQGGEDGPEVLADVALVCMLGGVLEHAFAFGCHTGVEFGGE